MNGKIKKLVVDRGFGFIREESGQEFFFHRSGVKRPDVFEDLYEGQSVTFSEEPSDKGARAVNVVAGE